MNNFSEFVNSYNWGELDNLLAKSLQEVVLAVQETGKTGKITLDVKVNPNGDGTVEFEGSVKAVVPKPSVGKAIFFTTEDGNLSRRDPRQPDLPLREVNSQSTTFRTIRD